jgi:hypothetical protein
MLALSPEGFRPPTTPRGCHPERIEGSAFLRPWSPAAANCPAPYSRSLRTACCKLSIFHRLFDFSSFNFELSTFNISPLSPFPATLTSRPQLHENKTTLSPVFATLTRRVKHKFFVCHSYKKHGAWGTLDNSNFNSPLPLISPTPGGETPCQLPPSCIDSSRATAEPSNGPLETNAK